MISLKTYSNTRSLRNKCFPNYKSLTLDPLGQRLQNTVAGNVLKSLSHSSDETLIVAQVVTEQALDAQQLPGVSATLDSLLLDLLEHRVLDLELVAQVVDSLDVVEPGSGSETQTAERSGHPDLLSNGGHDELGDLAGTTAADTGQSVADRGVGEALNQGLAVLVDVVAGNVGKSRLDLLLHHVPDEFAEEGVGNDFMHVLVAGEPAAVGNDRVASVQQTQLVLFEFLNVLDVLDDLDADFLEGGAFVVDEVVFDNPLGERFGDDGP